MSIHHQVHESFKAFVGKKIEELDADVREFSKSNSVAAKSVGIAYDFESETYVLTLGYKDSDDGYHVGVHTKGLAKLDANDGTEVAAALAKAASDAKTICHSVYIKDGHVFAILLTLA